MMLAEEVSELWKWPNVLLLAWALGYLIKKHGGPMLAARSGRIREGLEAGKKAQVEAEAVAGNIRAKMANLESEIAELRASAHAGLERETARLRRESQSELQRIEQHTSVEIEALGKRARLELRQYAGALAVELAEQKIRARMTPATQSALVESFASGLSGHERAQGGAAR